MAADIVTTLADCASGAVDVCASGIVHGDPVTMECSCDCARLSVNVDDMVWVDDDLNVVLVNNCAGAELAVDVTVTLVRCYQAISKDGKKVSSFDVTEPSALGFVDDAEAIVTAVACCDSIRTQLRSTRWESDPFESCGRIMITFRAVSA